MTPTQNGNGDRWMGKAPSRSQLALALEWTVIAAVVFVIAVDLLSPVTAWGYFPAVAIALAVWIAGLSFDFSRYGPWPDPGPDDSGDP